MDISQYISTLINKYNKELSQKDEIIEDLKQQLYNIKQESKQNNVYSPNKVESEEDILYALKI